MTDTQLAPATGDEVMRTVGMTYGQRFATEGTSFNAATREVDIVAATEGMVKFRGYQIGLDAEFYYEILDCSPEAVDLSQVRAGNAPLLDNHQKWSMDDRLGAVRTVRFEPGKVIARGGLGQNDRAKAIEAELAAAAETGAQSGLKASVGYRRDAMVFERMEGEIPVYRVNRWTFRELSFCPIAADPDAGVRSDGDVYPCTIMEGQRMSQSNESGGAAPKLEGGNNGDRSNGQQDDGQQQNGSAKGQQGDDGVRSEGGSRRVATFTATSALAFVEAARSFDPSLAKRAHDLIADNEAGKISVEGARSAMDKAMAETQRGQTGGLANGGRAIEITADEQDKFRTGAVNSILQRAGVANLVNAAAAARGEKIDLDPGEFRGLRNADLARMCLDRAGMRAESYDQDKIVGDALTAVRSGMNTTSDFPVLLENAMHKTLQASYSITPDTWRKFCGVGSVVDFRPHPRYLRGSFGTLDDRNEAGEFKNKNIPDGAKESISAKVKGNIIALTRDAIVNDDLSAFNFLAVELGRAANLSIEVDVYKVLALAAGLGPNMNDGNPLFHASHKNIGTGAAPSVVAFDEARQKMASQKDVSDNEFLDIRPAIWLGPLSLGGTARVINDSKYDPDAVSKLEKPNMVAGMFSDVVDTPRLTGTAWYAFADPMFAPAMEVVFLNGQQEPFLDSREGWRVDGNEWKVRHDYGVGALNWRSVLRNPGA